MIPSVSTLLKLSIDRIYGYNLHRMPFQMKGSTMKVRFVLFMEDFVVAGKHYDIVSFDWQQDVPPEIVMVLSDKWIASNQYLLESITDLESLNFSYFMVEPLEELPNIKIQ